MTPKKKTGIRTNWGTYSEPSGIGEWKPTYEIPKIPAVEWKLDEFIAIFNKSSESMQLLLLDALVSSLMKKRDENYTKLFKPFVLRLSDNRISMKIRKKAKFILQALSDQNQT